jgi:hypothetical protein
MKCRWAPGGAGEVGIDGYIELFDPATGEALGRTLAVQSKAVTSFDGDSADDFVYSCSSRDVEYWAQSNIPVILIVCRPASKEAYWISIKEYFAEPGRKGSTIHFSKRRHVFSQDVFPRLLGVSATPDIAVYLEPTQRKERLFSNLIELASAPPHISLAATECRTLRQVWAKLGSRRREVGGDWIVREKSLLGFEDFSEPAWADACEIGSTEQFDTEEWADSEDPERQRVFVQLLNRALRRQVMPEVRYWPDEECYAFEADPVVGVVRVNYRSAKRRSTVKAVSRFLWKSKDGITYSWLRHMAFGGRFRRIDGKWYLEVTPTYRFTDDGIRLDRFHAERLAGIKRIEGNRAVLSAVLFWADFLAGEFDLFSQKPTLVFGPPATFDMPVGIVDANWSAKEPSSAISDHKPSSLELALPYVEDEVLQ